MRFGCCAGLATFVPPTLEGQQGSLSTAHDRQCEKVPGLLKILENAGFDYVEFGAGMTAPEQSQAEYEHFLKKLEGSQLRPEVFNSFIPPWIKVVGPEVCWERLESYVRTAVERIVNAGGERIIFGSGAARLRPDNWPVDQAVAQLNQFLNLAADQCKQKGIILCIEHLNKTETNMINLLSEAEDCVRNLSRPGIRVLADCFHMCMEQEPFEHVVACGDLLAHIHVADKNRRYPDDFGYDIDGFFTALKAAGYNDRVSIEANFEDIAEEAPLGLERIRRASS